MKGKSKISIGMNDGIKQGARAISRNPAAQAFARNTPTQQGNSTAASEMTGAVGLKGVTSSEKK